MDEAKERALELYRAGNFEQAAETLWQVYQAHLAKQETPAAARALNDRGVCLRQAGRLDEAEESLLQARTLFQQAGDVCGEAQVLGNLGALSESRRDDARAIDFYRQATVALEKCQEPNLARDTWMALGRLRLRRREWLPAFAAYEMGLSDATQLSVTHRALRSLLSLARRALWRQS